MRTLILLGLFSVSVASCGKKSDDAKPATATASAEGVKPAEPPPAAVANEPMAPGASVSGIDVHQLGEKLNYQKQHRGTGPSTDSVFAAIEKQGFSLERRKQLLADVAAASYCENARTNGLIVVVCEYQSEKDAVAGKALVEKNFAEANSGVERVVHGAAVISVVHGGNKTADVPKILAAVNAV